MVQTLISIALSILIAWFCGYHARRRGRNPTIWFVAGAIFGIFALITLFIFPVRKAQDKRENMDMPIDPTIPKIPTLMPIFPLHKEKLWYYLDEQKKQFGPMSFDRLNKVWSDGAIREHTFVWNEAMENWQPFKDVIQTQEP